MSRTTPMSKAELLYRIEESWDRLHTFAYSLSDERLTTCVDSAGWSVKDHLRHLAAWEDSVNALLQSTSRRHHLDIDEETWNSADMDRINAILWERYKDQPVAEVLVTLERVHRTLVDQVEAMDDDDLYRPFRDTQTDADSEAPLLDWIIGNTYEHYEEHRPWMDYVLGEMQLRH